MIWPNSWGALDWWIPVAILLGIALPFILWTNGFRNRSLLFKSSLAIAKIVALGLLAICLLEPTHQYSRPEPGANSIVVLADSSQSLQVKDRGNDQTRAEILGRKLDENAPWLRSLDEQFELRRYQFDSRLDSVADFASYEAVGNGSDISDSLATIAKRLVGKPCAGIIMLTDGNSSEVLTAEMESQLRDLPPVYPVVIGSNRPASDISITNVETSQTNFESAPVTIKTEIIAHGHAGETVHVELLNSEDEVIEAQEVRRIEDGRPFAVRFQLKPSDRGVNEYRIRAFAGESWGESDSADGEATLINNQRTLVVDRGRGPFRVLYIAGRPNWEYKFMRRAIADDNEINLVGLLRVARKEPKFTFRGHAGENTNPLYRGFGNQGDATAEQYDEPVLIRLDTKDEVELRDGFPKDAATLFEYDAIVIDDLEANFFTQDQKTLISQFVSLRGGGLLMLGGLSSFASGGFDRTPIGELLPVYVDGRPPEMEKVEYRLALTREGWIQPWVRLESTRDQEEKRLENMPGFRTLNATRSIKPGASVLADVRGADDQIYPALVVQRFGKGSSAALLIGDLWRWKLKTPAENQEMNKSWRQTLRWLVSKVPRRSEITVESGNAQGDQTSTLAVQVFDAEYKPQLNSEVNLMVKTPSGKEIQLVAEQDSRRAGRYQADFASRETGAYRLTSTVKSPEGNLIEKRDSGWVSDPAVEEFRSLVPNRELLGALAKKTGGEVIELDELESFVNSFENREVPITETKTQPWWHRAWIFLTAIGLLIAEWGARRMAGMA